MTEISASLPRSWGCYCPRTRTIPYYPYLIGTYLELGFTDLKKLILNSILGRADGIPPKTFDLTELHIQVSGFGLFNSAEYFKGGLPSFLRR